MKTMYRCVIYLLDEAYKSTPPSNIFIRATSKEIAGQAAASIYEEQVKKNGYGKVNVRVDVIPSSEEEVELYKRSMQLGYKTQGSVN
jgi:hypothetical protein